MRQYWEFFKNFTLVHLYPLVHTREKERKRRLLALCGGIQDIYLNGITVLFQIQNLNFYEDIILPVIIITSFCCPILSVDQRV